jgi:transcriptional regulator GlxA family with amidase domain
MATAILSKAKPPYQVALLVFPGYELLDAYGPWEMLGLSNEVTKRTIFDLQLIGLSERCSTPDGPDVAVDSMLEHVCKDHWDILVVPGGGQGVNTFIANQPAMQQLTTLIANTTLVLSVCTGAAILAELGVLDGLEATTNKRSFADIASKYPSVLWKHEARWVQTDKFITSSGVTAGTDMTLAVLGQLMSHRHAKQVARLAEYEPVADSLSDPFCADVDFPTDTEAARQYNLVVVLYDNFELFDTFGCLEMVRMVNRFRTGAFNVRFVAEQSSVKSSQGPVFCVDSTFAEGLDTLLLDVDIVLLPGGLGTIREMFHPGMLAALAQLSQRAAIVATVCSGSAILASTGVLDNQPATTNKYSYSLLTSFRPSVQWEPRARWCCAGKYWTSSGVSAGTDMMLAIIVQLFGEPIAAGAAYRAEYVRRRDGREDPFAKDMASMSKAQWLSNWVFGWVVRAVFDGGLRLGFNMKTSEMSFL